MAGDLADPPPPPLPPWYKVWVPKGLVQKGLKNSCTVVVVVAQVLSWKCFAHVGEAASVICNFGDLHLDS